MKGQILLRASLGKQDMQAKEVFETELSYLKISS